MFLLIFEIADEEDFESTTSRENTGRKSFQKVLPRVATLTAAFPVNREAAPERPDTSSQ